MTSLLKKQVKKAKSLINCAVGSCVLAVWHKLVVVTSIVMYLLLLFETVIPWWHFGNSTEFFLVYTSG